MLYSQNYWIRYVDMEAYKPRCPIGQRGFHIEDSFYFDIFAGSMPKAFATPLP